MSKREEIRSRRKRARSRQRLTTILIVAGIALIFIGLLILPNLTPVTDITMINPQERPMAAGTAMGDPDAPVIVEEFADFQCSSCRRFSEEIEGELIKEYVEPGQVYLVFRHLPFLDDRATGTESDHAALASMCAADQDRFWDYHDILYANQAGENVGAFSDRRLEAFAETLGLEMDSFKDCFRGEEHTAAIERDIQAANDLQITGTPSIFVNGVNAAPSPNVVPSYENLSAAIEEALADSGS